MDSSAALIIATPILVPVATAMGFDLVHFGIVMIVNLAVGLLTPPLGVSLVVAAKVGNTSFEALLRPTWTFLLVLIIDIVLLTLLPQLSIGFANLIGTTP
jgi:C4-dicarboxylate transporter DctM subunit